MEKIIMKYLKKNKHKVKLSYKFRRFFLTSALSFAPLALVASCVNNSRFDSNEDNKLVFGHTFSSSGKEAKALEKIIEVWNKTATNQKDFIKMEAQYFQNGYNGSAASITNFLQTKDRIKLPNIVTNYPSLLAIVNKYSMTFPVVKDFSSNQEPQDENEKAIKKFLKEQGISDFLEINKEVPFLDTKGVYTLPFGKSTEVLTINKVLFGWMINKALADPKNPAKIKEEDKLYFAEFQKLGKEKTGDIKEIERIWKKYVSDDQGLAGYEFRRSDLENFTDLQKLSSRILRSFPEALSGGSTDSAKSVLGIDNQATLVFALARSVSEGNRSQEVTVLDRQKNLIDYISFIDKPDSIRYKNLEKIFNLLSQGIKDRSIYYTSAGEYNSTFFRNHQQVFSIGSTSGYFHNFVKPTATNYQIGFKKNDGLKSVYSVSYPKFSAIVSLEDLQDITKDLEITATDGSSKLKIDAKFLGKLKEYAQQNPVKKVFYFTDRSEKPSGIFEKDYIVLGKYKNDKNEEFNGLVIPTYTELYKNSGSNALNDDELALEAPPHKFDANSKITPIVAQGPDLIFIHSTEKEDKAAKAFVKWLLTEKIVFEENSQEKMTPLEYFARATSYLLPIKSTLDKTHFSPKNRSQKFILDQFSKFLNADSKGKYSLVYDNADANASSFRESLDSSVAQMQSLKASDGKVRSFKEFLEKLEGNLGPAFKSK
ncbi:hypothetical protein B5M19_00855 [Mesomycoplasma hyopneumoniae]|uniref:Lipoprotein n=2 Tax=Mesomycoplasma hyopneumoniae TaxID=2099 RepID=A0ABM5NNI4_MESH1|nr:lipoprotein [Mesomycoplasma hyopneumoniae 168-L]OWY74134.1 hypothetical protein B5M19_00855 [Mesomycoplasma hyopneumoniae]